MLHPTLFQIPTHIFKTQFSLASSFLTSSQETLSCWWAEATRGAQCLFFPSHGNHTLPFIAWCPMSFRSFVWFYIFFFRQEGKDGPFYFILARNGSLKIFFLMEPMINKDKTFIPAVFRIGWFHRSGVMVQILPHKSLQCVVVFNFNGATQQAMSSTHPIPENGTTNNRASEPAGEAVSALSQRPGGQIYLWKLWQRGGCMLGTMKWWEKEIITSVQLFWLKSFIYCHSISLRQWVSVGIAK